ncbi:hypothetical protein L1987_09114 [Smallanthus sonchifolius]|uniref:Uncharacterized protein n=1 Tax=Smallanthus sonchifolius TaxID=185202 RepID=A0ACB9JP33_9ASTR|nr:hypothetical protein L1987_09114 [Smallanthus sonchifolius]
MAPDLDSGEDWWRHGAEVAEPVCGGRLAVQKWQRRASDEREVKQVFTFIQRRYARERYQENDEDQREDDLLNENLEPWF